MAHPLWYQVLTLVLTGLAFAVGGVFGYLSDPFPRLLVAALVAVAAADGAARLMIYISGLVF